SMDQDQVLEIIRFHLRNSGESRRGSGGWITIPDRATFVGLAFDENLPFYVLYTFLSTATYASPLLNRTEVRFGADLPFNCNRVDSSSRVRSPSLNAAAHAPECVSTAVSCAYPVRQTGWARARGILGHHALPPASMFGYY